MTVKELKEKLQSIVDDLEQYDEDRKVEVVSNTYFLGHPYYFLGIAGSNGGYINLDNPCDDEEEDF